MSTPSLPRQPAPPPEVAQSSTDASASAGTTSRSASRPGTQMIVRPNAKKPREGAAPLAPPAPPSSSKPVPSPPAPVLPTAARVDAAHSSSAKTDIDSKATQAAAIDLSETMVAPVANHSPFSPANATLVDIENLEEGTVGPSSDHIRFRLLAGRIVPGTRYRIVRWLGEGGMGVVYEAEHLDIERRVAFKVLRAELSRKPVMAQVFRNEARAASKIGSPYIVEIFDFGELPDGRLYFCMELIEGRDLVPENAQATLECPILIAYLRQICKGLGAAHAQGIVHRDIKPENILVFRKDGRERIKLVDFGIAAFGNNPLTRELSGGTPHYMAPEQIAGLPCDARLDMYSLGCTAYELLTGAPPFEAERLEELLGKHVAETPRSIREIRGDDSVPRELEAVILRCLAKSPNDRYRDMADLEAAICEAQLAAGLQTPADDLPLPEVEPDRKAQLAELVQTGSFGASRRWVWVAMASLMIALGLAVPLLLRRPAELSPNAMAPIETLVSEAHAAGSRTNYVYPPQEDHLAATSYIKVLELESLEGPLAEPGRLRAQALRTEFAATLVSLGNKYWAHESARPWAYEYYTQALLFSPEHPTARERNVLTPTSLAALAQRAKRREFTPDELGFAQIVNALANTNTQRQEAELAAVMKKGKAPPMQESLARRALAATGVATPVPRVNADPITPVKDTLDSSSDSKAGEGSPSNRATQPRHAASSVARDGETPSFVPDRGRARELTKQAALERAQGRRVEAERLYHQATSHNPSDTAALIGLSEIYFDQGRYDESVRYAERAVKSAPKHANAYLQLGDALFKVLRYQDALAAYARAEKFGSKKAKERAAKVRAKLGTGN